MREQVDRYLKLAPWDALIEMINDQFHYSLVPNLTTLCGFEPLDNGHVKVILATSKSKRDDAPIPPFNVHRLQYTRLRLQDIFVDENDGTIEGTGKPVNDTRYIVDYLADTYGYKFDQNDFIHHTIDPSNMEGIVLKANPRSLRWVGELRVSIVKLSDSARFETPGTYKVRLIPGTYSVLAVGGGGGGTGYFPSEEAKAKGGMLNAAGGGSGFAAKGRIIVKQGTKITVVVGKGGNNDCNDKIYDWMIGSTPAENVDKIPRLDINGGDTTVSVDGELLYKANGSKTDTADWTYNAPAKCRSGGKGASGGGRSGSFTGASFVAGSIGSLSVVTKAGAGGSDGTNGEVLDVGSNGKPWSSGSGGTGVGAGYYSNIMQSIDPEVTHGIDTSTISKGGERAPCAITFYYKGGSVGRRTSERAGGGGGMGGQYLGRVTNVDGKDYRIDGSGYGAGGGGGNPGVAGLVSIVRIGD